MIRLVMCHKLETPKEWVRCFSALQNWDDETKQLFLSRLNERDITAKLDICQTNFSDCQHAAENFSEIPSGVIKSIFRETRCKQNRPRKSQRKQHFNYQIQVANRVFKKCKTELGKNPDDANRRHRYICEKQRYKKLFFLHARP